MYRPNFFLALAATTPAVFSVLAEVTPTTPTEDQTFHSGDNCPIAWDPDQQPSGWKSMRIGEAATAIVADDEDANSRCPKDLMSGSLPTATFVTNVVDSVGATEQDPTSFSWTCPEVEFDGPVYSYLFTPLDSIDPPEYSAQFTITGFNGSVDIPVAASASASASAPDPQPTNVANPSQGVVHLGSDSGDDMLENVPTELGGADSAPTPRPNGGNFLAQALGSSEADAGPSLLPAPAKNLGDLEATSASIIPSRMLSVLSASMSSSAVSPSPSPSSSRTSSSTATSTADASRSSVQKSKVSGYEVTRALMFALCVGHFVL